MRERPFPTVIDNTHVGITPARAGKTIEAILVIVKAEDHPRSCGKDSHLHQSGSPASGSPPLVRERPTMTPLKLRTTRITPARAGKTPLPSYACLAIGDHPRSCGKDLSASNSLGNSTGSPPLVRERLRIRAGPETPPWITPARAGKTLFDDPDRLVHQDHPRSCGKDLLIWVCNAALLGSPPLVRERQRRY